MAKTAALPLINHRQARRLLLYRQGLCRPPQAKQEKADLLALIADLGFVQVDSINTVERAHHLILWSRNQNYRRENLSLLLEQDRALFEHWTHDAAIVPTQFYHYWRRRFQRDRERQLSQIVEHVREQGPTLSRQLGTSGGGGWWDWHPSKTALEYLWRSGELAVARRQGFQKVYDLSERVIPGKQRRRPLPAERRDIDWHCAGALQRLGVATSGEIAAFWAGVTPAEAKAWCQRRLGRGLREVQVEAADGSKPRSAYMSETTLTALDDVPAPPPRLRVLSPFDPLLRDRRRALRLFGFDYRIEVFVPAARRRYGYYVFPLLEGDRLIGRIDVKRVNDEQALVVQGLWLEPGVAMTRGRQQKLDAELERLRRFVGVDVVRFANGFLNPTKQTL